MSTGRRGDLRVHTVAAILCGPLGCGRSWICKALLLVAVLALTLLTQIGGVALWLACGLGGRIPRWRAAATLTAFVLLYATLTLFVVPGIAPVFGRVPLACFAGEHAYAAQSPIYCALNRHYVRPPLRMFVAGLADHMAATHPGTVVTYLDGNFPFGDGFPLLPHLSHDDGSKVDIALFYEGRPRGGAWFAGYWAFAPAQRFEVAPACAKDGLLRWKMAAIQGSFASLRLDKARTTAMLSRIVDEKRIGQVFVEPYLLPVLGVGSTKIGFAGCAAARHDDHIHIALQ